jgi:hypothetical protein
MSFDYSAAKAAIKNAGHTVSDGTHVLQTDIKELVKFGRRVFGLSETKVRQGIANPTLLPEGFPGVTSAPVAEVATPTVAEPITPEPVVEPVAEVKEPAAVPQDAPVADETAAVDVASDVASEDAPVADAAAEDAPKSKKAKKGADSATAEQAAQ